MKMKKLYFLIIFLLLFSNISFSNKNKSNNWQLVWNDEFNDDKLDNLISFIKNAIRLIEDRFN